MQRPQNLLLLVLLALSPVLAVATTFDQNVSQFTRDMLSRAVSRDIVNPRDLARGEMARVSDAAAVQEAAQQILQTAEIHAKRAEALAQEGRYSAARAEAREAQRLALLANNYELGLTQFKRSVEKNARGLTRDFELPGFLTDAIGSFQADYISPLSERLQKIYSLIDSVYNVAQRAQGSEWLQSGLAYRTRSGGMFPVGLYNITFDDIVNGVTVGSEVTLGSMGDVAVESSSGTQPTLSRLSAQVGISLTDEINDLNQEARIGILGLGYRMSDKVSIGAGVSAQDGNNGIEPAVWASLNLSSLLFK